MLGAAGVGCRYLHRVLEVSHFKRGGIENGLSVRLSDLHEVGQVQNELASGFIPQVTRDDIV